MSDSLNRKIDALRALRVRFRNNRDWARRTIGDPIERQRQVHAIELGLASTESEWRDLMAQKDARDAVIALAQLRHTRPAAAPVRRSVAGVGYFTKDLRPGR